jgi:pilus assembly protein CpaB
MSRRILAIVAATVVALLGAAIVLVYAIGADRRALAEQAPVNVVVTTASVPEGTPVEQLGDVVVTKEIPASAVVPGAMTNLQDVEGMVTQADLQPGEQLLASRFGTPDELASASDVEIPEGLHQVTIPLSAERVLGGHVSAGNSVGVFVSLDGNDGSTDESGVALPPEPNRTQLILNKVLVTRVQGGVVVPAAGQTANAAEQDEAEVATPVEPQPAAQLMITLAVSPHDAERVVFAAEYARIWLSLEDDAAPTDSAGIVTEENLFQ